MQTQATKQDLEEGLNLKYMQTRLNHTLKSKDKKKHNMPIIVKNQITKQLNLNG